MVKGGGVGKTGADGVFVDVVAADCELFGVPDAVVGEAALPDGELGGEAAREAASISPMARSRVIVSGVSRRWMWSGMTTKAWSL